MAWGIGGRGRWIGVPTESPLGAGQWRPGGRTADNDPNPPIALESAPLTAVYDGDVGRPMRRPWAAAVYVTALAFVPVLAAAASTDASPAVQGGPTPASVRTLQYQALTGPVLVPSAAETITPDKWAPDYPDRVFARARVAEGATVAPVYVADVTDPVVGIGWAPTYPDRVPAARRGVLPDGVFEPVAPVADAPASTDAAPAVQGGPAPGTIRTLQYQALTGPVAVPVAAPVVALDWLSPQTLSRLERDGPVLQYAPFSGPVPLVLDLDWLPSLPDVMRRVTRPVGGVVAPVAPIAAPAETITLDKWLAPHVAVIRRGWRPESTAVAPLSVPDVTVLAPARSWVPSYPDRVPARPRRSEAGTTEALRDVLAELVTLDKWHAPHVTVTRRVLRPHGGTVAPLYVADVTVVPPLLAWSPVAPAYVMRLRTLRPLGWAAANIDPIGPPSHIAQSCLVVSGDRTSALLVSGDRVTPVTITASRQGFVYIVADRTSAVSVSGDRTSDVAIWIGECE